MFEKSVYCLTVTFMLAVSVCAFGYIPDQFDPAVAGDPDYARFLVAYQGFDNDFDDEEAIYLRIYYLDNKTFTDYTGIRLDSNHNGRNADPDIDMNRDTFVVAWTSYDTDGEGIVARVFDPNANPLTDMIQVNTTTTGDQNTPAIGIDSNGRFMVVWVSGAEGSRRVYGRIYDSDGQPLSSEITLAGTDDNYSPSVAAGANGLFTVAWAGKCVFQNGIYLQQFYPDGTAKTSKRLLANNLYTQPNVTVDVNQSGTIAMAWDGGPYSSLETHLFCQIYDPNGNHLGIPNPSVINTYDKGVQEKPSVAISDSGSFVVVWQSEDSDGNDFGIRGRRFDPNGIALRDEADVNLYRYRKQHSPDVAFAEAGFPDGNAHFFSVWEYEHEFVYYFDDEVDYYYYNTIDSGLEFKTEPERYHICGDTTDNSFVNMNDLVTLALRWLEWGGNTRADLYHDGHVDFIDFTYVAGNWMQCCEPSASMPPEVLDYYYQARTNNCSSKLRGIGNALIIYSNDYDDNFPTDLSIVANEEYYPSEWPDEMLMCPGICPHAETGDYVYRGNDLDSSMPAYMIMVYDRAGNHPNSVRNVLFIDGHVSSITDSEFQAAIEQDNAYRRSHYRLDEKPIE